MQVLNAMSASEDAPRPRLRAKGRFPGPPASPEEETPLYHYFTVDDALIYLSFYEDWGPLNIAMVYRACIYIHELLEDPALASHRLVLYASDDPRRKANAALLMALYVLIVHRRTPWEAFHPIAELEFQSFRDAGRGRSDFNLSIHDCLWGFWKAQRNNLIDMNDFSVSEYEFYEKVENGDWNWITPGFIAFASPSDPTWIRQKRNAATAAESPGANVAASPSSFQRKLSQPYQNCLDYFEERGVKLVVRLNNPLYDKTTFEERGMEHLELYFDDGTNPTDEIVRDFIRRSEAVHAAGGAVAVHCKAGLGRTGTLIGAYLIYKYNFTAHEAIAFMRISRPGCVVGPQQQYLYQRQLDWAKWAALDQARKELQASAVAVDAARAVTPPIEEKPLPITPSRPSLSSIASTTEVEALLPPGQPRKTPTAKRVALEMMEETEDDSENESDESVLGVKFGKTKTENRGRVPIAKQLRSATPNGKTTIKTTTAIASSPTKAAPTTRAAPASERPTRVTRASARSTAAATRKPLVAAPPKNPLLAPIAAIPAHRPRGLTSAVPPAQVAQRIPRPAATPSSRIPARRHTRATSPPLPPPPSASGSNIPAYSRLPPLVPSGKRRYVLKAPPPLPKQGQVDVATLETVPEQSPDAWMSGVDAQAVVEPATKSGRPSIRNVRKRRSSFSAADL